ncbi:MAG: translocation protein S66 [Phylliscum demangeonii]|nr:MAG: translocation protein S66 [Phylliscum demangeonii]
MVNWLSLVLPFAYLSILVGSLATFSSLYRKRKIARSTALTPWFPTHLQRNVYLSLLHLEPDPTQEKSVAVPESVLRAALLRRAMEDINRIRQIQNSKQALSSLLQRGSVGDDLWQRFLRAESEMEDELRDVVTEARLPANALAPNWGQTIFQSANEMAGNALVRKKIDEIQSHAQSEKEWWDQRRAAIQADFMKELDAPVGEAEKTTLAITKEKIGSDEDTVLVEGGGPTAGGKGTMKKRKNKK